MKTEKGIKVAISVESISAVCEKVGNELTPRKVLNFIHDEGILLYASTDVRGNVIPNPFTVFDESIKSYDVLSEKGMSVLNEIMSEKGDADSN